MTCRRKKIKGPQFLQGLLCLKTTHVEEKKYNDINRSGSKLKTITQKGSPHLEFISKYVFTGMLRVSDG